MIVGLRGGPIGADCAKAPIESRKARTKATAWRTDIYKAFMNTSRRVQNAICGAVRSAPDRQAAEGTDCHRSPSASASRLAAGWRGRSSVKKHPSGALHAASRDDSQKVGECRPQGDKAAHASPTDAKRSHPSTRLRWVTFWVTRKVPPC